jgi:hypothetical protein
MYVSDYFHRRRGQLVGMKGLMYKARAGLFKTVTRREGVGVRLLALTGQWLARIEQLEFKLCKEITHIEVVGC